MLLSIYHFTVKELGKTSNSKTKVGKIHNETRISYCAREIRKC